MGAVAATAPFALGATASSSFDEGVAADDAAPSPSPSGAAPSPSLNAAPTSDPTVPPPDQPPRGAATYVGHPCFHPSLFQGVVDTLHAAAPRIDPPGGLSHRSRARTNEGGSDPDRRPPPPALAALA